MNVKNLINELIKLNIHIRVQEAELHIYGSKENITPEIIARIKMHKAELLDFLGAGETKKHLLANIPIAGKQECYPISSTQGRLWLLSQTEEGNVAYNLSGTYVFEGELDQKSFVLSLNTLVKRHESLRTCFKEDEEGEVKQFIADEKEFVLQTIDLRNEKQQEKQLNELLDNSMFQPFDLSKAPLLRAGLYQLQEQKWIFNYVMHHIISDGWSMMILIEELMQLYNAYSEGKTNPLQPLRIQYKDYAAWQKEQLSGETLKQHKNYWLNQFEGELPVLNFPTDKTRPLFQTHHGGKVGKRISESTTTQLRKVCRETGSTVFMGLLSAVTILLHRYTDQEDIVIGSPIAGREHADLEGQIGCYLNTLALRMKFSGKDSFKKVLAGAKQLMLGAYEHQVFPFDELINQLLIKQDRSRNPLFDVSVVLQNTDLSAGKKQQLGDLKVSQYEEITESNSKFDLSFNFAEVEQEIQVHLVYNTDIYFENTAIRLMDHFEQLLVSMLSFPDTSINLLDFLTNAEKTQLLEEFNDVRFSYPKEKTIMELFEEQVIKSPDAIALAFDGKYYQYSELNETANQLGDYLRKEYAIKADDLVAIKLERSEWMIMAILGVLKSGAAYVPIDPEYPEDRISYMIADTNCKTVIDDKELKKFKSGQEKYNRNNLQLQSKPNNLAYVIYTSGSTGHPKGVMIEQASLVNFISYQQSFFKMKNDENILQFSNISFDASVEQIFVALTTGSCLSLITKETILDPNAMEAFLERNKITHIHTVPNILNMLPAKKYTHLRRVVTGGDKCPKTLAEKWSGFHAFYNTYGPTETTVTSVEFAYGKEHAVLDNVPIGKPVGNTQVYITDKHHNLVPLGVVGELGISGDGLARGYLNKPDLTKEKFIPNPFKKEARIYLTGDLVKWLPDGNISFVGRKDEQVKIRGYRIEPGEIEKALLLNTTIDEAIVVVKSNSAGDAELVAYLVSKEEDINVSAIRNDLGRTLPVYMIPSYFIKLETLPLMPNGKINRKALPEIGGPGMSTGKTYVAPRTETEKKLVGIWEKILDRERIGVTDNFFELGGHSLKTTRLRSQIQKEFGVTLLLKELFTKVVLEEQAEWIQQAKTTAYHAITPVSVEPHYALSSSQKRIWVLSQFEDGSAAYNMPGAYLFEGDLKLEALNFALKIVQQRHESLRTLFKENEQGEIRQFILSPDELKFELVQTDLRNEKKQDETLKQLVKDEFLKPFDLSAGPLQRAALFQLTDKEWLFTYTLHHIISDGWSMGVLIRELLQLYNSFVRGEAHQLPELHIHYKDYAVWQQQKLSGESLQQHKAYWLTQFEGELPVLDFPGDHIRPAVQTYNGGIVSKQINKARTKEIKEFCQQQGCTLFMGLLSAVNALLFRYTGQEDIIVGSPIAGREHTDLENQIGCYINTLALRTKFKAHDSFKNVIDHVKQVTLGAYDHQAFPFDELVGALNLKRDTSRSALFDVMVTLQNNDQVKEGGLFQLQDLDVSVYQEIEDMSSKFDLSFDFVENNTEIRLSIEYNSDIYNESTITRLMDHLLKLIQMLVNYPDEPISKLELLSEEEIQQQLTVFNKAILDYPKNKTIVDLFEEQVMLTPHHTALIFGKKRLTYAELNERVNRLAHYLRMNYRVAANEHIGIKLQRSEWMVICVLAVLKSGGAYVPIDPNYPEERIDYLLKDSQCKVLIHDEELVKFKEEMDRYEKNNPPSIHQPHDLAYVIYTSGSTGNPKGVLITHTNVVSIAYSWLDAYQLKKMDVILLQLASISFDVFMGDICRALLSGGRMIICPEDVRLEPESLYTLMADHKISILEGTPGLLLPLMEYIYTEYKEIGFLKMLILGSDLTNMDSYIRLQERFGNHMRIINSYGTTETTIDATYYEKTENIIRYSGNTPIGKPYPNTSVYILSPELTLQPQGVIGEVCIGGAGVGNGYLNRADLTTEKFIPHPFNKKERLYRTGDLGRWLQDGNLEFIGRKDDQVKIRGYRVELGEIENVLQTHPDIESAVVIAKSMDGSNELVAYILSKKTVNVSELRIYLGKVLPQYMLPAHFVCLEELPLTPNGKVDRKKLPDPKESSLKSSVTYVAPRNEIEQNLVSIYEEVLRKQHIGIKEDFFVMGGDSIKSIQVVSRLRQKGYHLTIQDILLNPVIEELAKLVKMTTRMISQEEVTGPVPLSPIQEIFFAENSTDKHHYNQSVLLTSKKSLNEKALEAVFNKLVMHHDALRMVFHKKDSRWHQENKGRELTFSFEVIDYGNETFFANSCEHIQRSIDLSNGPLLKVALFKNEQQDRLLIVIHHLVIDGVSWRILFEDLSVLYQQYIAGEQLRLQPKTDSFKYWQHQQMEYAFSNELQKEKTYWSSVESVKIDPLPLDFPKGSNLVKDASGQSFVLDKDSTEALLTRCYQAYRTEINDILLTALGLAFQKVFKQKAFLIQLEGHGRESIGTDVDVSRTIGWFTTLYPVVLNMEYGSDCIRQLIEIKETLHRIPNKGIGYGILRYLTDSGFKLDPQITFNYGGDFGSGIHTEQGESLFEFSSEYHGNDVSENNPKASVLDVSGIVIEGKLRLSISYSTKQFREETIDLLLETYRQQLVRLINKLSTQEEEKLTPVDLTYKGLTVEQLEALNT